MPNIVRSISPPSPPRFCMASPASTSTPTTSIATPRIYPIQYKERFTEDMFVKKRSIFQDSARREGSGGHRGLLLQFEDHRHRHPDGNRLAVLLTRSKS